MTGAAIVLLLVVGLVAGVALSFVLESVAFGRIIIRIKRGEMSEPCPVCGMCCCAECRDNTRSLRTREILTNCDADRFNEGALLGAIVALEKAELSILATGDENAGAHVELIRFVADEAKGMAKAHGISLQELGLPE